MVEPTLFLALAAGIVSFLSPCMLPVLPAFVAQLAGTQLGRKEVARRDVFLGVVAFVGGFSLVFSVLGVVLSYALQGLASETMVWLSRVAGAVVILFGLQLAGLVRLPILDRGFEAGGLSRGAGTTGYLSSFVFGACFAVAWTPCVGPILGSTLALAASRPAAAFPLFVAYSVGLGLPFLAVGLFPARAFGFVKRHRWLAARLHVAFGFVLVAIGVLVFTDKLSLLANFSVLKEVLL
ncbi:MAG: cytochrome c biogenesis CcdA family protein [Rubrobacter sp.]